MADKSKCPRVGLFVTCLVDLFRPIVGFATIKLLKEANCVVEVPTMQTCCGQPAYNSGDVANSKAIARTVINTFRDFDYLIAPSGSCIGMIKLHYLELFKADPTWYMKAKALSKKSFEILSFLNDVLKVQVPSAHYEGIATYHDSCAGLRELSIKEQPRNLLAKVQGLRLREMREPQVCCGFGGTFCVKYPDISERMVTDKIKDIQATGADTLLSGDMGCLLNIAGRLSRLNVPIRCFHTVEVLAGMTHQNAIGEIL
ncbi:MAG: (Fe-S)-binding protein [Gammaproteobacteria bacterium]|nr:(Fe-S)-binding protein [Gammaproteobacteria bacterium]MCI0591262.1 (Fe-S)-binding protein [Gammaproteobacteria bacterium]